MGKVKTFLHVFRHSLLPDFQYDRKIIKTPFSFSCKYYLTLILFVQTLFFFLFILIHYPKYSLLKKILYQTTNNFPPSLSITIENNQAYSNYNRPYFAWADDENKKLLIFVMDEYAKPDKIISYKSLAMLTRNQLVISDLRQSAQFILLSPTILPKSINKQTIANVRPTLQNDLEGLLIILAVALLGAVVFVILVGETSWLVMIALIARLLLCRRRVSFSKLLQAAFHAVTFPLIITNICLLFDFPITLLIRNNLLLSLIFFVGLVYETYIFKPLPLIHHRHLR